MGNTLGRKKVAKIMKINGETIKFKTPIEAGEVLKDYPRHVLLESESVKHFGIRAKPLEHHQNLRPKKVYFIVELPKAVEEKGRQPRRVRSVVNISAKDRLESLMLAKRSASDLSALKLKSSWSGAMDRSGSEQTRVKMRLPKAEVEKVMMESRNDAEVAEKIMELWKKANNGGSGGGGGGSIMRNDGLKAREKHVGFVAVDRQSEIQLAAI